MTRHTESGKTIMETLKDGFDYGQNPDKTRNGDLVMAYECDPCTADAEFLLSKAKYKAITGREQKRDNDVLYYHQRQAFPPGEVDAETALKISYETTLRWTKGNHAFFVVSHIDRPHPHCHIYYNSTTLDCTRKFRDFLGSARAFRRLSDRICLEKSLSIVEHPKLHSKGKYKHYGQWAEGKEPPAFKEQLKAQIDACLAERPASFADFLRMMEAAGFEVKEGRGGALSFRNPAHGQERFTCLRADTLGKGYGPDELRAVIEQGDPLPGRADPPRERRAASGKLTLVIDIQARMRQGKGPGYEQWAKIHNLKEMSKTLVFLQENGIEEYGNLVEKSADTSADFNARLTKIKKIGTQLSEIFELQKHIGTYGKTRETYQRYKASGWSEDFFETYCADITRRKAAKQYFDGQGYGKNKALPSIQSFKQEYATLLAEKKKLYSGYHEMKEKSRVLLTAEHNTDRIPGIAPDSQNHNAQHDRRQDYSHGI